ncbi:MAG: hypothetical protein HC896_07320 [Bacteroidales bacterium]|nr:hypothetical protein [Bacteroidales bacterium]
MLNLTRFVDYSLVYLLVAMSGVPFFVFGGNKVMAILFMYALAVFIYRKKRIHKFMVYYLLVLALIQILQTVKFYFMPWALLWALHMRILFAYFVLSCVEEKFLKYYVNTLVVSTLISLVFYFASYVPGFENMLNEKLASKIHNPLVTPGNYRIWPNIIVYTLNTKDGGAILRNSGPFWEPGANAGFLVLAIIFNIMMHKTLFDRNNKILMFGLLTTMSTTGLVAMMVIVSAFTLAKAKLAVKIMVVPIMVAVFGLAYSSLDILGKKIEDKMNTEDAQYNTRFGSFKLDLKDALENPFVGLGVHLKTRFKGETDPVKIHRNNGVSMVMGDYGIIVFLVFFSLYYINYRRLCMYHRFNPIFALYALALTLLIGFSETYFSKPLFFTFTFIGLVYKGTHPLLKEETAFASFNSLNTNFSLKQTR